MDIAKMVDVIQERHGITLDPADPIFLLATVAAELNKENREEFRRLAVELSDQVSAALVLADTTAKARSERLITEAAKWSAEQIRGAGAEAAQQILTQSQHQPANATKIAAMAAAASAALMILLWAIRTCG